MEIKFIIFSDSNVTTLQRSLNEWLNSDGKEATIEQITQSNGPGPQAITITILYSLQSD